MVDQKAGFRHDAVEDSPLSQSTISTPEGSGRERDRRWGLLTHRPRMTDVESVRNIVFSGNQTAIRVNLNDPHHNRHRAEPALAKL